MRLSTVVLAAICSSISAFPLLDRRWDYGKSKIRGVNLGGWLVLEPWITPSLWSEFDPYADSSPVDEYTLMKAWGKTKAQSTMNKHWATWYTKSDFQKIRAAGMNTVRIPIGYWAFQLQAGDPYVQGQAAYLDKAIQWAREVGLKVWIDLHGAPGSQNGFDNSGRRGAINWQKGSNVQTTLAILKKIANKYAQSSYADVIIGIELLNEPLGPLLDMNNLRQFYNNGLSQVRSISNQVVVVSDAFQSPNYWNGWQTGSKARIALDHHHYQIFSPGEVKMSSADKIKAACAHRNDISGADKWVITGEWSAALTDCAPWLNGFGRGSRFEGQWDNSPYIGSCANRNDLRKWSAADKVKARKYIEAQIESFETQAGWIFWTWKAEAAAEWDMSWLLQQGVFPNPVTSRKYPNVCG